MSTFGKGTIQLQDPTDPSKVANITTTGSVDSQNIIIRDSDGNALANGLVPEIYDYIALTYVASGNGAGEIETVTYKTGGSGGTTQATLTLGYDANDKLSTITKS